MSEKGVSISIMLMRDSQHLNGKRLTAQRTPDTSGQECQKALISNGKNFKPVFYSGMRSEVAI